MSSLIPNQIETIHHALQVASTYIDYVKNNCLPLHEKANGTPPTDQEIAKALVITSQIAEG